MVVLVKVRMKDGCNEPNYSRIRAIWISTKIKQKKFVSSWGEGLGSMRMGISQNRMKADNFEQCMFKCHQLSSILTNLVVPKWFQIFFTMTDCSETQLSIELFYVYHIYGDILCPSH
eukprot:gene2949-biopygen1385